MQAGFRDVTSPRSDLRDAAGLTSHCPLPPSPRPRPTVNKPEARDATRRRFRSWIGGRAPRQTQGLGRGGCDENWTLPCKEGRRETGGSGGAEGEGTWEAGPGAALAPLARQSPGCRERNARGPGPGHRTLYRTRPSLELGQLPTLDSAPDTAPHRAGHYNGHYFPAPDIAPSFPLGSGRFSPSPFGGPDTEPPAGSS